MPIATLRFNLPEEESEFLAAQQGQLAKSTLWGIDQHCRSLLRYGQPTPEERQLAEEIIAGQTVEIQSMQRRLHTLQQRTAKGAEAEFPSLGGTRGP